MEKKKQIKKWLLIGVIVFVVLVAVELIAVRIVDSNMEKESFALNTLDKVVSNEYAAEECSHIVKRELTADEIIQQKILQKKHSLMIYNNIGLAEDIVLPDGSWFLDKSPMIIRITDGGSEERSTVYFTLENQEIMNRYLSYWKDNYYSYDKTPKEMVERYRYYQLVFDRFYLNDMTIIPQKVSIYKVERMPKDDAEYPEITACILMETIQLETSDVKGIDCYEIATTIDANTVANLAYDYTCNGAGEYRIIKDCTLNGKVFSSEERKQLLIDCMQQKNEMKDRDLIGFSNYYYRATKQQSELLGGEVMAVGCESNIYYNAYRYAWLLMVAVLVADLILAAFITGASFLLYRKIRKNV